MIWDIDGCGWNSLTGLPCIQAAFKNLLQLLCSLRLDRSDIIIGHRVYGRPSAVCAMPPLVPRLRRLLLEVDKWRRQQQHAHLQILCQHSHVVCVSEPPRLDRTLCSLADDASILSRFVCVRHDRALRCVPAAFACDSRIFFCSSTSWRRSKEVSKLCTRCALSLIVCADVLLIGIDRQNNVRAVTRTPTAPTPSALSEARNRNRSSTLHHPVDSIEFVWQASVCGVRS